MFEDSIKTEKTVAQLRGRAVLWGGTALVLLLAVIIFLFARSRPQESHSLEGAARAGAAEFEAYKSKVEVEITNKVVHPNMIGMFQMEIRATIHNRGDKPVTGLEVVGKMLDMEEKVIAQRISIPIPLARPEPLKPGESLPIRVKIDAPSKITEDDVKDLTLALQALKFQ